MNRRLFVTSVLALVGVLSFGQVALAGIQPEPFRTGLFGITAGQAIRVSVLYISEEGGTINPCVDPEPLEAAVSIRGLDGAALFESRAAKVSASGGTFVDYVPVSSSSSTATRLPAQSRRLQVRAEVSFSEEDLMRIQAGGVALALEVFDVATGRTEFTMPFAAVMFNPHHPPDPAATP